MKLLHISPDPRALNPASLKLWGEFVHISNTAALYESVEWLVTHNLAPLSWLEDGRIAQLASLGSSVAPILRNPRALIDAEEILREGLAGTGGTYVGLKSWEQLCGINYAADTGRYVPIANEWGHEHAAPVGLSRHWLEATRDTGTSYGGGGDLVWYCARQILGGPAWITDLYRTGLGLWCLRETLDSPEWVLLVRPGNGLTWPERKMETGEAPITTETT